MDTQTISWVVPLLLIPGIGQLLNATSARYGQYQLELHTSLEDEWHLDAAGQTAMLRRGLCFRNALVGLHLSVLLFAIAGLIGAILIVAHQDGAVPVLGITTLGIVALLYSTVELMRETFTSQTALTHHAKRRTKEEQM